jgi:hypothetical protein
MAVFGHSGSQAPQLMHSLVMTVAMPDPEISPARRALQTAWPAPPAGATEDAMRRLLAGALLLAAATASAEGIHEMQAAFTELKLAKDHLRQAGTDYGGHRKTAMEYVDKALREVRQGIDLARSHEGGAGDAAKKKPGPPATGDVFDEED